jgi:hypothetical protein
MARDNTNSDGSAKDKAVGRPTEAVSKARVARGMYRIAADDEAMGRLHEQWRNENSDDDE